MNRIKILRNKLGLTQRQLGKLLTVSQQAIHQYENSESEPDISTLKKMSEIFGVSIDTIVKNDRFYNNKSSHLDSITNNFKDENINNNNLLVKYKKLPKDIQSNIYNLIEQIHKSQNLSL